MQLEDKRVIVTGGAQGIDDDWDLILDVNARGTLNTNRAAFPYLREAGGRIVDFGSAAGVTGMPGAAHDAIMAQTVPLGGRLGDPDHDMAPVLVFLLTDGGRFITGQTLAVDGGMRTIT